MIVVNFVALTITVPRVHHKRVAKGWSSHRHDEAVDHLKLASLNLTSCKIAVISLSGLRVVRELDKHGEIGPVSEDLPAYGPHLLLLQLELLVL